MAVTTSQVQQLYIAYFNRPADFFGLTFQTAQANQFGLQFVADQFSKSPEYIATYAGMDTGDIINTIYLNLFGRVAEPAGLKFWGDLLKDPKSGITVGNAAITIATGAINDDKVAVANKLVAANAFYGSLNTNAAIVGYSGAEANQVLKTWMTGVTTQATLDAAIAPAALVAVSVNAATAHDGVINVMTTQLTKVSDTFVGTAAKDTIVAVLDGVNSTLTALDSIDGGAGVDTLQINDLVVGGSLFPAGLTVKNVETVTVRGADDVIVDSATWTGVTSLKVLQSVDATVSAASTTAIEVTGATGAIVVDGGASQAVSTSAAGAAITLGATTVAAGALSATHSAQAAGAIAVDGGSTVAVTATGVTTGTINVGQGGAASDLASGAVTVTSTGKASVANTDVIHGAIQVKGGASVVVTQAATASDAAALTDIAGSTTTQSAVTVNGGANTTAVTVSQSAEAVELAAIVAVAGVKSAHTVTFGAMASGETLIVNGLTFTASKALTAAQVATAFANLAASGTQGNAPAANGIYSGTSNTLAFTTGAVTTAGAVSTVTFTSTTNVNLAAPAIAGTAAGTSTTASVAGSGATTGVTGVLGVTAGLVAVDGNIAGTDVLATVNLNGFGAGSTVKSDALTSLWLANSANDVTVTNTAASTLALSVNAIDGSVVGLGATYTTLNVTTTGNDSAAAITAAGVLALNVAGTKALDLTGSAMTALKTVTVKGSAGLVLDASGATVTSVDASGTSGDNMITINAANATYVGGMGVDAVVLSTAVTTKAVSLGDGNDSLQLASGTTALTANMSGGNGTDTLIMDAADAATASATTTFATKIDGFEKLSLGQVATTAAPAVDLANLDNISYVVSAGIAAGAGGALTLNHMGANGTLELTGAAAGLITSVSLTDATGTADALNIVTKVAAANLDFGIVSAAGVESIVLTVTDTSTSTINTATLNLKDAALKSVAVNGNANLTLTQNANVVALTSVDGSGMTGKLVASTNGTVSETIKGGLAADTLTAVGNADVLNGGAGADTLIVTGNLATLTGGTGNDTFNISTATTNVNSYATITDLTAGDMIQFAASGVTFKASKVSLGDTAVFQDFANAAINATIDGDISWFQFNGNTYVVENGVGAGTSFTNGTDIIVKITGAVDLSTASYSSTAHLLLIA